MMEEIKINHLKVKTVLTKSNLPIAGYSVNPYVGCTHACRYCYACFMKRFTGHTEEWGTFLDVKHWDKIKDPLRYAGQTMIVIRQRYYSLYGEFNRAFNFILRLKAAYVRLPFGFSNGELGIFFEIFYSLNKL